MPANPVEFILMFSTGFVAFVLLLSGVAKVGRAGQTVQAMTALGVPRLARHRWIATAVPFWEIGVGAALLLTAGGYQAGAAALALCTFAIFTVFVARVLRRGDDVDCGCFGALSADDRVTGWTAARNVVLMLACLLVMLAAPGRGSFVIDLVTSGATALWAALAWLSVAVGVLLVSLVRLRRRLHEAPGRSDAPVDRVPEVVVARDGAPIPDAELVSPDGVTVPLYALGAGSPVLLVFLSAECGKCAPVARRVPDWQKTIGSSVLLRVATSSRPDVIMERIPEVLPFARYGARSASRALDAAGIPTAVLLGGLSHPFVASPVARGEDEIDALVRGIANAQAQAR